MRRIIRSVRCSGMSSLRGNSLALVSLIGSLAISCSPPQPVADTGDTGTAGTDTGEGSCIPGEPDCECNNGLCLGDLECIDNVCVSPECIPGEENCECNMGLCLGDLYCLDGI